MENETYSRSHVTGVNLPLTLCLGKTRIPLKDVLTMNVGTTVPLDGCNGNQVEILVNNSVIGWGELITVDDFYGVRIQRLAK